ncbi:hypothetical protein KIL84_019773 [Mauremys mutica]|uniref:Uncharacterized protein n=1 Tax=Mauremys mutica TaxID=74926 RepID=A0A9D3XUF2_9SAUR|nr:hypothetical protein KIL84_019773 [Mauremys mutica]
MDCKVPGHQVKDLLPFYSSPQIPLREAYVNCGSYEQHYFPHSHSSPFALNFILQYQPVLAKYSQDSGFQLLLRKREAETSELWRHLGPNLSLASLGSEQGKIHS